MSRKRLAFGSQFTRLVPMSWIWEQNDWPNFTWNHDKVSSICREIAFCMGSLDARAGVTEKNESLATELDSILKNILHSSEIEGETLNVYSVRSSLAKRLKLKIEPFPTTKKTEGLADLQFDIFRNTNKKVTTARLFQWHRWLFPETKETNIRVGKWRGKNPMLVVSGRVDNPKVHFDAPSHKRVKAEMKSLLDWFEESKMDIGLDPFVRAGILHLWFLTIHPFEDGNGRLARVFSELALAQYNQKCAKLYSLSSSILENRKDYYSRLETTQRGDLDITNWIEWYLSVLKDSILNSIAKIEKLISKTRFWRNFNHLNLLPEQKKILNLMLDSNSNQFDEGISASQYQKITKVSKATATRHLTDLLTLGCLKKLPVGGRSTKYILAETF